MVGGSRMPYTDVTCRTLPTSWSRENHGLSISIEKRRLSNFHFADDIDLTTGSNDQLQAVTDRPATSASAPQRRAQQWSTLFDRAKQSFIWMVCNFTSNNGSFMADICQRITAAIMAKLKKIRDSRSISFDAKLKLSKSLVAPTFLYGSETRTRWPIRKGRSKYLRWNDFGDYSISLMGNKRQTNLFADWTPSWYVPKNFCSPSSRDKNWFDSSMLLGMTHCPRQFCWDVGREEVKAVTK